MENSLKPPQHQKQQKKLMTEDASERENLLFSADDVFMDLTQTHTGNIDPGFKFPLHQSVNLSPTPREQTLRLTADDNTAMDMTQCLTENIISNSVTSVRKQVAKTCDPPHNRSLLSHGLNTRYKNPLTSDCGINPVTAQMAASGAHSSGFTIRPEDDVNLDMTEAQAGYITEGDGSKDVKDVHLTNDGLQSLFPSVGTHPQSFNIKKAMTSYQQSKDNHQPSSFKETSMKTTLKTMQTYQVKFDSEDHREKTVRFTADDAGMDVTKNHTVNIISDFTSHGEKTVRFTNDAAMDVTQSHTGNIVTDLNALPHPKMDLFSANREKTVRFTADDAGMDVTKNHTVNIISDFTSHGEKTVRFTTNDAAMDVTQNRTGNIVLDLNALPHPKMDLFSANGEKTVKFTAADACMDVTQSHTVNIVSDLPQRSFPNVDSPANAEKTVRFTTNDAAMDVTRSHTVNIASGLDALPHPKMDFSSAYEEKTVRFTPNDAAMDVTRSHTVNISTDLNKLSHHINLLPADEEKTERFTTKNVLMDATKSHTVNISTNFEPKLHKNVDFQPTSGDKTMRFTTSDARMDMTSCFTVNIATNVASDRVLPDQNIQPMNEPIDVPLAVKKTNSSDCATHSNWFSSAQVEEKCVNPMTQEAEATDTPSPQETADLDNFQLETQKPDTNAETESPSLISAVVEKPVMETMTDCAEISANITDPQTGCLRQTSTDYLHQNVLSTQANNSGHLKKCELLSQNSEALGSSTSSEVETKNLNFFDSNKMETVSEDQQRTEMFPPSEKIKAGAEEQEVDAHRSRKSRRLSLADLQSKVKRLSQIIKTAPDNVALDPSTAPLPQLDPSLDKNSNNKTMPLPALQPEPEICLNAENTEALSVSNVEQPSATTPFSLKTQQLMSTLSVGCFKPKLPKRTNHEESKKLASAGEATRTLGVTSLLGKFDDVDDINDEELGGFEDMSETLNTSIPEKSFEKENPSKGFSMLKPLDESALKEFGSPVHGQKRPLQEDTNYKDDEKRLKACTEHVEMAFEPNIECDTNIATTCLTTQSIDSSSSHTGSRCDARFESTNKHSLFESQLEEWSSDGPKKLKDGTITVHEFFKLFNIDFVIHNPRQSILPGRFLSETDATPLDLLKDRHISRPKQTVYEADVQTLKEKVEGLKVRMQDLDKPLQVVNGPLWQEIMHFSKNEQITAFGAKLKERIGFFRKLSKNQSHEMKVELYSNLVQINLEQQQKLRGKLEEADEMTKRLDDCICELEAELLSVEEKGSEDKPSLKSLQEELSKVTEALANGDRKITELEMENKQNSSKLNRLKAEAGNLESHINMLNTVNEWRLREKKDDCTSYTFLHETMLLQLMYEKSDGNDADDGSEKNLANITFKFDLDDEKSQSHARLVHKLVSQYIEGESAWVEKYPTNKDVPKLLHDVSLVVSRCRLLGEELRLLKMWGSLKFDILDISCVDTRIHIVFSSLRRFSKFEVVFGVSLINKLNLFEVQSFKSLIGSTSIQQIEDIVASLTPEKKLFTKIIKKIHNALLC